jgi:hypothetical protein
MYECDRSIGKNSSILNLVFCAKEIVDINRTEQREISGFIIYSFPTKVAINDLEIANPYNDWTRWREIPILIF